MSQAGVCRQLWSLKRGFSSGTGILDTSPASDSPPQGAERPGVHSPSVLTAGLTHALSRARAGSVLKS